MPNCAAAMSSSPARDDRFTPVRRSDGLPKSRRPTRVRSTKPRSSNRPFPSARSAVSWSSRSSFRSIEVVEGPKLAPTVGFAVLAVFLQTVFAQSYDLSRHRAVVRHDRRRFVRRQSGGSPGRALRHHRRRARRLLRRNRRRVDDCDDAHGARRRRNLAHVFFRRRRHARRAGGNRDRSARCDLLDRHEHRAATRADSRSFTYTPRSGKPPSPGPAR